MRLSPPPTDLLLGAALFLDFDGTLVELAERPEAIAVSPGLPSLLERLSGGLEGRLAIVTGRSLTDLARYLPISGLCVSGSHGAELRLAGGGEVALARVDDVDRLHKAVAAFAATAEGLLAEPKPAGVALHYRAAPDQHSRVASFMDGLAVEHGLIVQHGKMVTELRAPGVDKGAALRRLMAEPGFAGARPVMIGDDLTDEHAFEAARALGGAGILVGPEHASAAAYRLDSVEQVHDWLERQA